MPLLTTCVGFKLYKCETLHVYQHFYTTGSGRMNSNNNNNNNNDNTRLARQIVNGNGWSRWSLWTACCKRDRFSEIQTRQRKCEQQGTTDFNNLSQIFSFSSDRV